MMNSNQSVLQTPENTLTERQLFSLRFSEAAKILGAEFSGPDAEFTGVAYDSRMIQPRQLFVAIPGEKVDGHAFLQEVFEKGAAGALVNRISPINFPQIKVEDTVEALGKLAAYYRNKFSLPILALTGSCGKTTVKEMIVSILRLSGSVLFTQGNLNTEIGIPLTLFHLQPSHQFAVIEMGARKPGDIRCLMNIAKPDVTLITNAGVAHLGVFGDTATIAKAKGEIFEELKTNGIAIINADDAHAEYWRNLLPNQTIINFGLNVNSHLTQGAQASANSQAGKIIWVTASELKLQAQASTFNLHIEDQILPIVLNVPGKHSVSNALSAAAAAYALGMDLKTIKQGLENFKSYAGRLQFKLGPQGSRIIDDTYNANPVSVKAALEVLAGFPGRKIFVMGDMLELGPETEKVHRELGLKAKELSVDCMLGIGNLTQAAIEAFKSQGGLGIHFSDKKSLIQELLKRVGSSTTVLVKGSRGMRMEEIVNGLVEGQADKSRT